MSRRCHHPGCDRTATTRITSGRLPAGGLDACDNPAHYDAAIRRAGKWWTARLIQDEPDDGQEALFDMPDPGSAP